MTSTTPSTVRIGIIGIGNMGTTHATQISKGEVPGLELAAIADFKPEKAELFPKAAFFNSGADLIASGKVDAVLIATPHYDHTILGIAALEAGLHTLVEKPISVHKADCERLIAAHKDENQVFAAMFNQRTDPRYIKLKHLIESGEFGKINRVQWTITDWFRTAQYYSSGGWRATWEGEGGGVLLNQCPHQLDLWQWLFGMPESVRAHIEIGRFHDIEVEDDVTAYLRYKDGMSGVFITTTGETPGTNRLEIAAERGRIIVEGHDITWTRNEQESSDFCDTTDTSFGRPDTWKFQIPFKGRGEQHLGILKNFANTILKGEKLIAPAKEGIHSVELANAMIFSGLNDCTVEMPLDADAYEKMLMDKIKNSTHKKVVKEPSGADDFSKSF
ncbi:MAG: Gfo/Idh/MocA family oxidoreductase [Kiritimatiellae bacterium]|nr:Gfo/Idh/MocA family oxidoreductase [Kiritimatiellia bacterium]